MRVRSIQGSSGLNEEQCKGSDGLAVGDFPVSDHALHIRSVEPC